MSISVELDLGYEFTVKAGIQDVFDLVSDVPRSVSHFPKVEQLDDLGGGAYRWRMEKVGTAQVNIQTIYASQYVSDRKKGSVVWSPVAGEGNAQVGGSWKLSATKKGTKLQLRIHGVADVPLPFAIPYGFFPFTKSYSSGFIMPTYGDETERGFYLRDGGYYFAISDKMDLKLLGEIYTKGSWGLSAASNYRKRYRYSGSFYASYQNTINGE